MRIPSIANHLSLERNTSRRGFTAAPKNRFGVDVKMTCITNKKTPSWVPRTTRAAAMPGHCALLAPGPLPSPHASLHHCTVPVCCSHPRIWPAAAAPAPVPRTRATGRRPPTLELISETESLKPIYWTGLCVLLDHALVRPGGVKIVVLLFALLMMKKQSIW